MEFGKQLPAAWKDVSEEQRKYFEELAKKDQARYDVEYKDYLEKCEAAKKDKERYDAEYKDYVEKYKDYVEKCEALSVHVAEEKKHFAMEDKIMSMKDYLRLGQGQSAEGLTEKQAGPFCAFREGQNLLHSIAVWNQNAKTDARVGLIKDTKYCGTTSVSNGVACMWAKQQPNLQPNHAVLIHNGGGGGFKYDVYAPKVVDGTIVGMIRVSDVQLAKDEVPLLTHLIHPCTSETYAEYAKQCRALEAYAIKAAITVRDLSPQYDVVDVIAFATGPLRAAYYKANMFDQCAMMSRFQSFCGPLGGRLRIQDNDLDSLQMVPERNLWVLPQQQEGAFEEIAIRAMYENLARSGQIPPNIQVVFTGGAGTTSSQLTTGDLPYGMTDFAKTFAKNPKYAFDTLSRATAQLPDIMDVMTEIGNQVNAAVEAGKIPIFALKSGFVLDIPKE